MNIYVCEEKQSKCKVEEQKPQDEPEKIDEQQPEEEIREEKEEPYLS